jgi:hypothetical protein
MADSPDAAPWRRPADEGPDSPYDGLPLDDEQRDHRTRAAEAGSKQAVRDRDAAPYVDFGRSTNKGRHR